MLRYLLVMVSLVAMSAAVAAPTVIVNGETVNLSVIDRDGKAFIDIVALMQLLGGKATYNATAGKLYINSTTGTGTTAPPKSGDFGTAQLAGDSGQIGQVYTLRTSNPIYFRLNSVAYSVSQLRFGKLMVTPEADEKLLVLHYSLQNPQKIEALVRFDTLKFTAVDQMNVNHDGKGWVGDEQTQGELGMRLKPAQRVEAYTCIVVPAKGVIPKLMVMPPNANDGPILRYDLRDKVTALPAPFADPADPTGATALEVVPGQANAAYPLKNFDVKVEKWETVTTALDGPAPKAGESYFVVTLSCTNKTGNDAVLRFDTFAVTLVDADGLQLKPYRDILAATSNVSFSQRVASEATARIRVYFTVPKDVKPKTFTIKESTSRSYAYDVSGQE